MEAELAQAKSELETLEKSRKEWTARSAKLLSKYNVSALALVLVYLTHSFFAPAVESRSCRNRKCQGRLGSKQERIRNR